MRYVGWLFYRRNYAIMLRLIYTITSLIIRLFKRQLIFVLIVVYTVKGVIIIDRLCHFLFQLKLRSYLDSFRLRQLFALHKRDLIFFLSRRCKEIFLRLQRAELQRRCSLGIARQWMQWIRPLLSKNNFEIWQSNRWKEWAWSNRLLRRNRC